MTHVNQIGLAAILAAIRQLVWDCALHGGREA